MGSLDGRVAIVTGGRTGIGRAIVRAFEAEGATVVAASRRTGTDVRDEKQVRALVRGVHRKHGRIDILVNNAGLKHSKELAKLTPREWAKVVDTNLTGAFLCTREVLPILRKQKRGEIVMISSVYGLDGSAGFGAYAASKHGMMGFSKAVLEEALPHGVRVSCICPGWVGDAAPGDPIPNEEIGRIALFLVTLHPNAVIREIRVDRRRALIV